MGPHDLTVYGDPQSPRPVTIRLVHWTAEMSVSSSACAAQVRGATHQSAASIDSLGLEEVAERTCCFYRGTGEGTGELCRTLSASSSRTPPLRIGTSSFPVSAGAPPAAS